MNSPLLNESIEYWKAASLLGNEEASIYLEIYDVLENYYNLIDIRQYIKKQIFQHHQFDGLRSFENNFTFSPLIRLARLYREKGYDLPKA